MKTLCCLIAVLASSAFAADPAPSNTMRATRVIHFDASPQKRAEIIDTIVNGRIPSRVAVIADATAGVPANSSTVALGITVDPLTDDISLMVYLETPTRPDFAAPLPRAAEAADAAVNALIQSLTPESQQNLQLAAEKRSQLQMRRSDLSNELDELHAKLRKQTDSVDVSPATVRQLLSSLQTQRESLSLDQVAKQARADALTIQIAKFSDQLAKKVEEDPVATELQKVVEYQQKSLEQLQSQQKSGVITQAEVDKAVAELAEARAKSLERKGLAAAAAGGDTVAAWNKELMNLSIDKAELSARLKAINERLDRLSDAGSMLDRTEQLRAQIDQVTAQLAPIESSFTDLQMQAARDHVEFKPLPDKSTNEPAPATQPATQPAH